MYSIVICHLKPTKSRYKCENYLSKADRYDSERDWAQLFLIFVNFLDFCKQFYRSDMTWYLSRQATNPMKTMFCNNFNLNNSLDRKLSIY